MPRRNLIAVIAVLAVSLVCWRSSLSAKPRDEMMELYGVFVDAVEQVEANYVRSVPRKDLLENALRGMLQSLDEHRPIDALFLRHLVDDLIEVGA